MRARTEFPHQVQEIENVWIPLRDGARLAARVWMPVDAVLHPVPAVLEYLPYRKDDGTAVADAQRHPYFAGHGYAAVRVDLRGTGDSDGVLLGEYLPQEQDDALEVLAWLADQPWCTGEAGMIGYSWGGFNGLQVAARRPPQLKAVITIASTDDRYLDDCHYMGGCLLASDMLKWASSMLCYTLQPPDRRFVGEGWRELWLGRLEHAPDLAGDWVSHQFKDAFWKHGSVAEDYDAIQCPVMVVGGWADAYTNAVPRLLENLKVPRLGLIGPWGHMLPYEGVPGPAIGFLQYAVRWWDQWLKGIDTGIMEGPALKIWMQDHVAPATFHALRPGRWIGEASWPPPTARSTSLILGSGTTLGPASALDAATLVPAELAIRGHQECGETAGVWCANGNRDEIAGDQSPDDAMSLCFTTEPLPQPVEVLGFPVARLLLSVDRPCALVAVRLEDVAPDGTSLLVSWGMLNLTHRDGHESTAALDVGRWYEVAIEARVCGHRFDTDHRIRLALSPTYWPHAWPSPEPVELRVAVDGPSTLDLPVRPHEGTEGYGPAHEEVPTFASPEVAAARATTGEARAPTAAPRDERTRTITTDGGTRLHTIVDHEAHSCTIPDTGARYTATATDVYSVVEEDPLSAAVYCRRETRSVGREMDWRVAVVGEMTCDAANFFLKEEYRAYQGEELIYTETRGRAIPRQEV